MSLQNLTVRTLWKTASLDTIANEDWAFALKNVLACVLCLSVGVILWTKSRTTAGREGTRRLSDLPGPKGIPILGNALQIPQKGPWIKFTEWAAQYGMSIAMTSRGKLTVRSHIDSLGDIYYLNIMGRKVLVLNGARVAHDLLHKRGTNNADRPGMALARDQYTFLLHHYATRQS